jgi:hypothetical protein
LSNLLHLIELVLIRGQNYEELNPLEQMKIAGMDMSVDGMLAHMANSDLMKTDPGYETQMRQMLESMISEIASQPPIKIMGVSTLSFNAPDALSVSIDVTHPSFFIQVPPTAEIQDDVHYIYIPGTDNLCIRFYPGGSAAKSHGVYFMDLYDRGARKAIAIPTDFHFYLCRHGGSELPLLELPTIEAAFDRSVGGLEKIVVDEGVLCCLRMGNKERFEFMVPCRTQARQATTSPWGDMRK